MKHRDSVDGVGSITANNINFNVGVLKPDDVREAPTLNTDSDDDTDTPVPATLSSSNIELGSDPLSQPSPSAIASNDRKVHSAHSSPLLAHNDMSGNGGKRSASMDTLIQQPPQPANAGTDDSDSSVRNAVRYGDHLTLEDHQRLQRFLEEFVTKGLLPHLEQLMRTMNDRVSVLSHCGIDDSSFSAMIVYCLPSLCSWLAGRASGGSLCLLLVGGWVEDGGKAMHHQHHTIAMAHLGVLHSGVDTAIMCCVVIGTLMTRQNCK